MQKMTAKEDVSTHKLRNFRDLNKDKHHLRCQNPERISNNLQCICESLKGKFQKLSLVEKFENDILYLLLQ